MRTSNGIRFAADLSSAGASTVGNRSVSTDGPVGLNEQALVSPATSRMIGTSTANAITMSFVPGVARGPDGEVT